MLNLRPALFIVSAVILFAAQCPRAAASDSNKKAESYVRDHAEIFSIPEKQQADKAIALMTKVSPHKGLMIETIKSLDELPAQWGSALQVPIQEWQQADEEEKDSDKQAEHKKKLFDTIGLQRIAATGHKGVYVLVCMELPQYVQVSVSPDTEPYFTQDNRDEVQRKLVNCLKLTEAPAPRNKARSVLNKLRKYRPNYGLRHTVDIVSRRLRYNRPSDNTTWIWSTATIAGALGLWLVLGFLQTRLRQSDKHQGVGVSASSEVGLPVAPLGGATGAVAGEWLFRKLRAAEPADAPPTVVTITKNEPAGAGSDY